MYLLRLAIFVEHPTCDGQTQCRSTYRACIGSCGFKKLLHICIRQSSWSSHKKIYVYVTTTARWDVQTHSGLTTTYTLRFFIVLALHSCSSQAWIWMLWPWCMPTLQLTCFWAFRRCLSWNVTGVDSLTLTMWRFMAEPYSNSSWRMNGWMGTRASACQLQWWGWGLFMCWPTSILLPTPTAVAGVGF